MENPDEENGGPDTHGARVLPGRATALIARGDLELSEKLFREPVVREALKAVERHEHKIRARRQLLATSLRLGVNVAPDVHRIIGAAAESIGLEGQFELFVYPGAEFNAAAVRPEGGRYFIMISSALLEGFEEDELAFVLGHELGHHLFDHHRMPVGALVHPESGTPRSIVLRLFAWQRYAEISCDRAGVFCAGGVQPAARALFKLASGIASQRITIDIDAFMGQLADLEEETHAARETAEAKNVARADWFSSHPFSPLRVRAVQLFAESESMKEGGMPMSTLESEITELLSVMEPSYLQGKTEGDEALRRLLFTAGILLAYRRSSSGELDAKVKELEALEGLLGTAALPARPSLDSLSEQLPARVAAVVELAAPIRRFQVVRDLCLIAKADGQVTSEERALIEEIASGLDVDLLLVDEHLDVGKDDGLDPAWAS